MVPFGHFIIQEMLLHVCISVGTSVRRNYSRWVYCLLRHWQLGFQVIFPSIITFIIEKRVTKTVQISFKESTQFININCILKIIMNFSKGSIDVTFDTVYSNDDLNSDQIESAIKNSLSGTNQLAGSTYQVDPDSIGVSGWFFWSPMFLKYTWWKWLKRSFLTVIGNVTRV